MTVGPTPSVHVRAMITWLAIFPMVAVGMTLMAPFSTTWPPVLRALVLTAVVVPSAVYLVVPRLLAAHHRIIHRTTGRKRLDQSHPACRARSIAPSRELASNVE
ncbi:hypothetical protein [Nocardia sp. NPDC006630]|uniref:hypothetical protein n=1 Tax=Nocardia sp. NPDC006630 TaxID=3157181 RepID=UPI0033BEC5C9